MSRIGGTMRMKLRMTFVIMLILMMSISLMAQKPEDLTGTWIGNATLDMEAEPNELTLLLEVNDGKLTGKMTDQYGAMNDKQIEKISLEEGVFSFSVSVEVPNGTFTLEFKMNVSGETMKGELSVPELGASGTWEANKQK